MTERERYAPGAFYVRLTGDYQQCVKEFGELTARFSGDAIVYNQLALCLLQIAEPSPGRRRPPAGVRILPNHPIFRGNLALDASYAGDFETAEQEAQTVQPPSDLATLAVAFAQMGQGRLPEATETYQKLAAMSAGANRGRRPVWATWRCTRVVSRMRAAVRAGRCGRSDGEDSRQSGEEVHGARVRASDGRTRGSGRRRRRKSAAAQPGPRRPIPCGADLCGSRRARQSASACRGFASEFAAEPQAYGKIIEGVIALKDGDSRAGGQVAARGQWRAGYVVGPLRSRAGLPGRRARSCRRIQSSTAASSGAARRWRCSWTRSPRLAISRPCTTTRVGS